MRSRSRTRPCDLQLKQDMISEKRVGDPHEEDDRILVYVSYLPPKFELGKPELGGLGGLP